MDKVLEIGQWIIANYQVVISALVAVLGGLITIFLLVPGDQPEKFLKTVVDFLAKFSVKPPEKQ